jgi:hypothetical protein
MELLRWLRLHEVDVVISLVALALSMPALFFALKQYFDSKKVMHDLESLEKDISHDLRVKIDDSSRKMDESLVKLAEITRSVSTKFVGRFPGNVSDILDLSLNVRQSIDIIVDSAGYGHYSSPSLYYDYRECLCNHASQQRKVRMLIHTHEVYQAYRELVYPENEWTGIQTSDRFKNFFHTHRHTMPEPLTWQAFQNRLATVQEDHLEHFLNVPMEIRVIVAPPPQVILWLSDEKEAVFSFLRSTHNEVTFRTSDSALLDEFKLIFQKAYDNAIPYKEYAVKRAACLREENLSRD